MREGDQKQAARFSYLTLAQRIPANHLARQIRVQVPPGLKLRGLNRVDWLYRLTIVAHTLVRMRRLISIEEHAHSGRAESFLR